MDYVVNGASPAVHEHGPVWAVEHKGRILVVDDDAVTRSVAAELLRDAGYAVSEAGSGAAALALLESATDPVQLLVTDVDMPGMNGGELARRLRERMPALAVLVVTGLDREEMLARIPADAVILAKPYRINALLTTVGKLIAPKS